MELNNICAVDFGTWTMKLAALNENHRFEVLVNEANFRETPSLVSFTPAERLFGDEAVTKLKTNFKNTIRSPQRYIGLANKPYLLIEQMKYSTAKSQIVENSILFQVEQDQKQIQLTAEQITIALFTKLKQIFILNNLKPDFLFVSIKPYLINGERKALKSCAQCAGFKNVSLIEEWEALISEYYFIRKAQIESIPQQIIVIFVDLGYSNFSIYACSISRFKLTLLDQQILRFTGSKNVDSLLAQFYIDLIKKQSGKDIRENPKAVVKLFEAVQFQRKKLSANQENQLVLQCLIGDYDLTYNMTREQLENISMPVLADFASSIQNLRSRVEPIAPIYSVELIGGFSRMPFVQQLVKSLFNMQASRKMNSSQSIARGTSIVGAGRLGLIKANMCNFVRNIRYPIVCYLNNVSQTGIKCGKNLAAYNSESKKPIFDKTSVLPTNTITKITGQGLNEVLLCQENMFDVSIIGYFSFNDSDNLTFLIDGDGILRARLMKQKFESYDLGDFLSLEKLKAFQIEEENMIKRDLNIIESYELRNQFESLLYKIKQRLEGRWSKLATEDEKIALVQALSQGERFLGQKSEHSKQEFKNRIEVIQLLCTGLKSRQ